MGDHELKMRQKHLFCHSMWSPIIFKTTHFFCTWWTLLTHFGTHLFGLPPTTCRSQLGLGRRFSSSIGAIFEGCKPPKLGGRGWIECAINRGLSHIAQGMVCFWFGAVGDQCAPILGPFGGGSRTYCGVRGAWRALRPKGV